MLYKIIFTKILSDQIILNLNFFLLLEAEVIKPACSHCTAGDEQLTLELTLLLKEDESKQDSFHTVHSW
jgi:hypothetical protein